jgi:hypothetical protein
MAVLALNGLIFFLMTWASFRHFNHNNSSLGNSFIRGGTLACSVAMFFVYFKNIATYT